MDNKYIERLAEKTLKSKLDSCGAVLVAGPKFCGKSTMCERFSTSKLLLKTSNAIELANSDPYSALIGNNPRLIDEWQKAPEIWNVIKDDLDRNYQFGKYILTGSTTPVDPSKIQHSGAGRITSMVLKPFSLFESGESNGFISLSQLFNKADDSFRTFMPNENICSLSDIAHFICRGGWPISVMAKKDSSINVTKNYFNGLFTIEDESDDFAMFLKNKNIDLLMLVLKSFARNISTDAKNTTMIRDILSSGMRSTLDDDTFLAYEKTLKDLYIIYDMPPYNLNLRSTVSVRVSPTHHFIDTSIATAALGINPADLMNDIKTFGLFFEDLVVRDLSIYSECFDGSLKHYRDSSGQEVDAIIQLPNSEYCAVEIKIASEKNINEGIASLNSFERKMKESNLKTPTFKMIVTSHGGCYKKDGIYIVPITYLKN